MHDSTKACTSSDLSAASFPDPFPFPVFQCCTWNDGPGQTRLIIVDTSYSTTYIISSWLDCNKWSLPHPHSKVNLLVPVRILFIPNNLGVLHVASKAHSAVWIHKLLLYSTNVEKLLHCFKVARIHLRNVFTMKYTDC